MTHSLRAVARAVAAVGAPRAALVLALAAGAAQAQEQPWYLGAKLGYTHDSNVFRRTSPQVADNVTSAGVMGGFHWRPGRQHLYVDADAQNNRYGKLDQLNNTSHSVSTGLDWQTVGALSGSLRYVQRENLGDFAVVGTPAARNLARARDATASVRYGYVGALGFEAGVSDRKADYTLTVERNTTSNVAWVGARYAGGGALTFGVTARGTRGEAPLYRPLLPIEITVDPQFGALEPDEFDRRDLDFNVTWVPSGVSTVAARISLTREDHTAPSRIDFSGVTGQVTWEYKPTGKTIVRTSLMRDTGNETSFLSLTQFGLTGLRLDNNRVNWIGQLEADWAATAKIVVSAGLRYIRGTTQTIGGGDFDNNQTRMRLGARWKPSRPIGVGCDLMRDSGSASASATVFGCSAEFIWQ